MEVKDFKYVSAFGQNIYYIYLYYEIDLFSYLRTFGCATFFFWKKQENQQFHEKNIHKDILFVACKFLKIKLGEILSMNQCLPNAKTINQTPF